MSDWEQEVADHYQRMQRASEALRKEQDSLKRLAVHLSTKEEYSLQSVADLFGWQVAYLRKLRKRYGARQRQLGGNKSYVDFVAADRNQVEHQLRKLEGAEADKLACEEAFTETVRKLTTPCTTPSMSAVGEVVGLSRQRIVQILQG